MYKNAHRFSMTDGRTGVCVCVFFLWSEWIRLILMNIKIAGKNVYALLPPPRFVQTFMPQCSILHTLI